MSYRINRLVKSTNREGDPEVFIDIEIDDDLGNYHYGKWFNDDEYEQFQADYSPSDFTAITHAKHLKTVKGNKHKAGEVSALDTIIEKHLPRARKQQQDAQDEENYQKLKRLKDLQ